MHTNHHGVLHADLDFTHVHLALGLSKGMSLHMTLLTNCSLAPVSYYIRYLLPLLHRAGVASPCNVK